MYFFDIGHPCYDQLTPVKIRYLLTSGNKVYVCMYQYHVTISRAQVYNSSKSRVFPKLTADQMVVLIGSRAHVSLTYLKPGRIVWKPANASPGLKFIQIITFSSIQMFFFLLLLLCFMFIKFKTENLIAKLQNSNRNQQPGQKELRF